MYTQRPNLSSKLRSRLADAVDLLFQVYNLVGVEKNINKAVIKKADMNLSKADMLIKKIVKSLKNIEIDK